MKHSVKIFVVIIAMVILLSSCSPQKADLTGISLDDLNVPMGDLGNLTLETPDYYIFRDDRDTRFEFDRETGDLRVISRQYYDGFQHLPELPLLNANEMQLLADEFIAHFINPDDYTRVYQDFSLRFRQHEFHYIRAVNGFETAERSEVWVTNSGNVTFIRIGPIGMFDDVELPQIDSDVLDEQFEITFRGRYGNADFDITNQILEIDSNILFMNFHYLHMDENGNWIPGVIFEIVGSVT